MKCLLLSVMIPCVAASMCLRFLKNERETKVLQKKSGYIWRWNAITAEFENLEALTFNNSAFCSVDTVNDLRGKTVTAVIDLSITPYMIINPNTNEITGFMGDVWKILEETLKFKTIYKRMHWSAIWSLSEIDELLIGTSLYGYTSSYLTYSVPFTTIWYALFIQSDGEIITTWWYLNIFSYDVWTAAFVSVVCVACSIIGVQYIKKHTYNNTNDYDDELSSPVFNILYVLGGTSGQGLQKVPKDLPMRIIMLSLLMMGMLLSYGFSSTLTSCLASKGNSVALTDLEEVAMKRTHSLCVRNNSGAYRYFTVDETADGDLQDKWKGLVNENCPDMLNKKALVSKLCRPGLVYLEVPGIFLTFYRRVEHTCELLQLQTTYWKSKLTFMHSRMASHRRLIDAYLMRMRSAGILTYLEKKWVLEEFNTPAKYVQSNIFQPVEYNHIRFTIWLLVTMMFVSVLICILENIWYRLRENSQREYCSLALPRARNVKLNLTKTHRARQVKSRVKRVRRSNSILLLDTKNSEFFLNATIRIDRWQMSRSRL